MECNIIEVPCKSSETFNISIYGDTHEESRNCDYDNLRKHMDRRAALPNARFIALGDMSDMILPNDAKRYMPSGGSRRANLHGFDAVIDEQVKAYLDEYGKYPWDLYAIGNHEHEVLKRHYVNPGERISTGLGCKYGGYSGYLRYVFILKGNKKRSISYRRALTILYHHGAWGGRVIKGFGGARDYGRAFEGWDLFCYGHNHQLNVHQEAKLAMTQKGNLVAKDVYYVNTGTWLRTSTQGEISYGEKRGYAPVALGSPLVQVTPIVRNGNMKINVSISIGDC